MHGNKEELIDRTFMLVIPKADLYIGEGMFLRQWIDKLVKTSSWNKLELMELVNI